MCIRDRLTFIPIVEGAADEGVAVSYTHLDVYKRQLRNRRSDLLPLYLAGLEAEIASIRLPRDPKADSTPSRIQYQLSVIHT